MFVSGGVCVGGESDKKQSKESKHNTALGLPHFGALCRVKLTNIYFVGAFCSVIILFWVCICFFLFSSGPRYRISISISIPISGDLARRKPYFCLGSLGLKCTQSIILHVNWFKGFIYKHLVGFLFF